MSLSPPWNLPARCSPWSAGSVVLLPQGGGLFPDRLCAGAGVEGSGPRGLSVLPVRIPLPRCGKPARCVSPREVNQQLRQSTGGPITCRVAWPRTVADSSAAVVRVPVVTFSSPAADRGPWTAFGLRSSRMNAAPRMQPVSETLLSECARDEPAWMREGRPAPTCWILPSSF